MTCMAELPLESSSESMDSEYSLGLSPLGALSEAKVIIGSRLGYSCPFGRVDAEVKEVAEVALAMLRVVMPKVTPLATRTLLFFAPVAGTV
ncbi:hypothetical protein ACFX2C_022191 [Malus domestica]